MTAPSTCRRCGGKPDGASAMFCDPCWQAILQEGRDRDWRRLAARRDEPDHYYGPRWRLIGNRWERH